MGLMAGLDEHRRASERQCRRFTIPGSFVSWGKLGYWRRRGVFSEEKCPVVDLSKGGLGFLTDNPPELKTKIGLVLTFSEREPAIELKGNVVYRLPLGIGHSFHYRVGVRFRPFGSGRSGDNLLSSFEVLKVLEQKYCSTPDGQ